MGSGKKSYREEVQKKLEELEAGGGTDLSGGLLAGLDMVKEGGGEGGERMKRVIFLTDMGLFFCFFFVFLFFCFFVFLFFCFFVCLFFLFFFF